MNKQTVIANIREKVFNPKRGGDLPQLRQKRTSGERRVDCYGDCGRRILLSFNPSGNCRKCTKLNKARALRMDNRKKRGTLP